MHFYKVPFVPHPHPFFFVLIFVKMPVGVRRGRLPLAPGGTGPDTDGSPTFCSLALRSPSAGLVQGGFSAYLCFDIRERL